MHPETTRSLSVEQNWGVPNHRGTGQVPARRSGRLRSGKATDNIVRPQTNSAPKDRAANRLIDPLSAMTRTNPNAIGLHATNARQNARRREARKPSPRTNVTRAANSTNPPRKTKAATSAGKPT